MHHRSRSSRPAFSLVEVLVAIVLLTVGLVALEGTLALAVRGAATADRESRGATLAARQRERVFALCASGSGVDSANGVTSQWLAVPAGRNVRVTQTTRFSARAGPRVETYDALGGCP